MNDDPRMDPSFVYLQWQEPFADYEVQSQNPGLGFYLFVLVYTALAFLLILPLVSWKKGDDLEDPHETESQTKNAPKQEQAIRSSVTKMEYERSLVGERNSASSIGMKGHNSSRSRKSSSVLFDQSYPDQDPDFRNRIASRFSSFEQNADGSQPPNREQGESKSGSNQPTETSSSVPSAATTSKVHQTNHFRSDESFSRRVLGVGGRRWKNRRPIGRVDFIEKQSSSLVADGNKEGSLVSGKVQRRLSMASGTSSTILPRNGFPPHVIQRQSKGMSDVASSILSEQYHQLHHQPQIQIDISLMKKHQLDQLQQQHQFVHQQHFLAMQRMQQRRLSQQRRFSRRRSTGSSISDHSPSIMPSIVDDISPDDAADANDPGRGNIFVEPDEKYWINEIQNGRQSSGFQHSQPKCCSNPLDCLVSVTAPDSEKWSVLKSSIPLALGASSEAFFRLINIAFISQKLGTESMIAFLLVGLFVRMTSEELAGAIIDALSSFVQAAMDSSTMEPKEKGYVAGQYIQLAFLLQLVLNIPMLMVWAIFMGRFVTWLQISHIIAEIAKEYASIVVVAYMIQALTRTLTVAFHISGHEHFESIIDVVAAAMQVVAIACVVTLVDGADLCAVGYIQVLVALVSAMLKIIYPIARGWMKPYRKGLIQNIALLNHKAGICHLLKAAGPLLLGTILEYGEWELLTLFIKHLGPAEVATWALLGAFWDFLEAFTEGMGEAAAIKVAYLLSAGQVERAKTLCHGAIYMITVQALLVTSALFMSGQYLAVLFTNDPAMQHILNDTIVMIGFANITMAYSRITWSLIGAQGRFRLATFVIFSSRWLVTIPCALISIFVFSLNLIAVSGSLVVGYATACCALTFIIVRSDWSRLVRLMQVMNQPPLVSNGEPPVEGEETGENIDGNADDPILGLVDLDDFDDSDDDSDGFGFGDYSGDRKGTTEQTSSVGGSRNPDVDDAGTNTVKSKEKS